MANNKLECREVLCLASKNKIGMPFLNETPKGHGFILLNVLRVITLVALVLAMVASWAMIVLSGLTGKFSFFDTLSHFWVFLFSIFLALSECNVFPRWYENNWPALSTGHSLAWLGLALLVIGTEILDSLGKPVYASSNIGLPIWRLVLAGGILSLVSGVWNIIASLVFRDGKNGITARHIRNEGLLATRQKAVFYDDNSQRSASVREQEKNRFSRIFNIRKSKISAPLNTGGIPASDMEHGYDDCPQDRSSPIIPTIQRPASVLHPAYSGSHYSEAHMDKF